MCDCVKIRVFIPLNNISEVSVACLLNDFNFQDAVTTLRQKQSFFFIINNAKHT